MEKRKEVDARPETGRKCGSRISVLVPRQGTLDGFAEVAEARGGVDMKKLSPLTRLWIKTHNSTYDIVVLDPWSGDVVVQGGRFFSSPTRAVLSGSSFGGHFLKTRWIGLDMRMEIYSDGRRIVTSPVRSIEERDDRTVPGPF